MRLTIEDCGIMVEPQLGMKMDQLMAMARKSEDLGIGFFFRSDHVLPTRRREGSEN